MNVLKSLEIADLKTAEIVALYNAHAVKPVKKFVDRATAEERLTKLADDKMLLLVESPTGPSALLLTQEEIDAMEAEVVDPKEDAVVVTETTVVAQPLTAAALAVLVLGVGAAADAPTSSEHTLTLTEIVGAEKAGGIRAQIEEAKAKREAETKTAKKAAPKVGARGPAPEYLDTAAVTVLTEGGNNPKKAGTASHARFAAYTGAATVADFLKAGGTRADLRWDVEHGHVKVG